MAETEEGLIDGCERKKQIFENEKSNEFMDEYEHAKQIFENEKSDDFIYEYGRDKQLFGNEKSDGFVNESEHEKLFGKAKFDARESSGDDLRKTVADRRKEKGRSKEKISKMLRKFVLHPLLLLTCLYFFICALDIMSIAFRLLGGQLAGKAIGNVKILSNPLAGLMIGMIITVLLQSSSTTTSIIITMIATGMLSVKQATFMIMGANIGTSITNTIVALGQMSNREEFKLAFAGATVHDMFNWLTVIILLPLEVGTGYLYLLSEVIVKSMKVDNLKVHKINLLNTITQPLTELILPIDKQILTDATVLSRSKSIIRVCCDKNETTVDNTTDVTCLRKCCFMFMNVAESWGDKAIGGILLIMSLGLLIGCLIAMVRILKVIFLSKFMKNVKGCINSKKCGAGSGIIAIFIGCVMTILVQSSSVFTSALTPLVGTGFISLQRMFALTLGANVGTTVTGLLSALAQDVVRMDSALQAAFIHLFFNISGILIWYPVPHVRKVPINMAKTLGKTTYKYRWFAVVYLMLFFITLPLLIFGLSMIGWWAPVILCCLIIVPMIVVFIISKIQRHSPQILPEWLQNWTFLPLALRSLEPYDRILMKLICCKPKPDVDIHSKETIISAV